MSINISAEQAETFKNYLMRRAELTAEETGYDPVFILAGYFETLEDADGLEWGLQQNQKYVKNKSLYLFILFCYTGTVPECCKHLTTELQVNKERKSPGYHGAFSFFAYTALQISRVSNSVSAPPMSSPSSHISASSGVISISNSRNTPSASFK